jgi:cytochrome P450
LVIYPDVQEKIHKELDERIGGGRSPSMDEIEGLEYLNAAWNEAMRLNPPSPVGKPFKGTTPIYSPIYRGMACKS